MELIPSLDGKLLILHQTDDANGEFSTFQTKDLVERSPFLTANGLIFRGQKESFLYGMNIESGKAQYIVGPDAQIEAEDQCQSSSNAKQQPNSQSHSNGVNEPLIISRTNYFIGAYDGFSGAQKFNFTYSEISSMLPPDATSKTTNAGRKQSRFIVDEVGKLVHYDHEGHPLWEHEFGSPISGT